MVEAINPVNAQLRLAQLLGDDELLAQVPAVTPAAAAPAASPIDPPPAAGKSQFSGNLFEDILSKAITSLNDVSRTEVYANQMVEKYAHGQADLEQVMVAQAKMGIMVQMAVSTVNQAVSTFQQITQMQM